MKPCKVAYTIIGAFILLINSVVVSQPLFKTRPDSTYVHNESNPPPTSEDISSSIDKIVYPSYNDQSQVSIAINPLNSNNLLIGANTNIGQFINPRQGYYYSTNGSSDWLGDDVLPGVG